MMPTGMLVLRPIRAKIQPLAEEEQKKGRAVSEKSKHRETRQGLVGRNKEPPCSPAGDADGLQDVDAKLADVDEEKDEEAK